MAHFYILNKYKKNEKKFPFSRILIFDDWPDIYFLLSQTFNKNGIEVISNKSWLHKGQQAGNFGEQPIDVAYSIMTLSNFYDVFLDEDYHLKMKTAFNWFLGNNRLHQIIYNPCTGGCYDGLEETHVNLNQGAESTVSYLMARLTIEKYYISGKSTIVSQDYKRFHSNKRKFIFSVLPGHPSLISLPLHLEKP